MWELQESQNLINYSNANFAFTEMQERGCIAAPFMVSFFQFGVR